ncbi:right-handed parallel beta-helix repeat-containing protein [Frankia sp. Cpl3]|nr:right-handed parallel beta-helix repeat-containing protein [Frankia sp. Cpl3]
MPSPPRPFAAVTLAAAAAGLLIAGCQPEVPTPGSSTPTSSATPVVPSATPTRPTSPPSTAPPTTPGPGATTSPAGTPPPAGTASPSPTSSTPPGGATGALNPTIVVSPTGNDSGRGTLAAPFATVQRAVSAARPGDVIALRGGVYQPTAKIGITTSGTAASRIVLTSYGDEHAVIDGSRLPSTTKLIITTASYWDFGNLELRNSPQQALYAQTVHHTRFRHLDIHGNQNTGLDLTGQGSSDNLIENVDSYDNHDNATGGQNADGIGVKFGSGTGNIVRNVRVFNNSDDGLDLWAYTSPVTIENSWAYGNGVNRWNIGGFTGNGNGFKLGGGSNPRPAVAHVVRTSAAWANTSNGFTENGNPGSLQLTSNTAYGNGGTGFYFSLSSSVLRANLSVNNRTPANIGSGTNAAGNSWTLGGSYSAASFVSVDDTRARGARAADGSLPTTGGFLRLTTNPQSLGAQLP